MWISGINCWGRSGYSIGSSSLGMCFNVSEVGNIDAPYKLISNKLHTNTILANGNNEITSDDDVILTGNLNITGNITASNSNPFYIGGKVSGGGTIISSSKTTFTVLKTSIGVFIITPSIAFGSTNYIVNVSCQYGGGTGCYSAFTNSLTATAFTVITMSNTTYSDCIFHFTVIN